MARDLYLKALVRSVRDQCVQALDSRYASLGQETPPQSSAVSELEPEDLLEAARQSLLTTYGRPDQGELMAQALDELSHRFRSGECRYIALVYRNEGRPGPGVLSLLRHDASYPEVLEALTELESEILKQIQ